MVINYDTETTLNYASALRYFATTINYAAALRYFATKLDFLATFKSKMMLNYTAVNWQFAIVTVKSHYKSETALSYVAVQRRP